MIWLLLGCIPKPGPFAPIAVHGLALTESVAAPSRSCSVQDACEAAFVHPGDRWFSTVEGDTWRGCVYVSQDDSAACMKDGDKEPLQVSPERFEQLAADPEQLVALLP